MNPPKKKFKVEIVGFGDTYQDAVDNISIQLDLCYVEQYKNCVGGHGWIKTEENEDALVGEEYYKALRKWKENK
jgi:hypothetical protein